MELPPGWEWAVAGVVAQPTRATRDALRSRARRVGWFGALPPLPPPNWTWEFPLSHRPGGYWWFTAVPAQAAAAPPIADHPAPPRPVPGDIKTEPSAKLIFNAPFSEKNVYNIRLLNNGAHRIGYAIKTTNMKRLEVNPSSGVLDPKEAQMLTIAQQPFPFRSCKQYVDRISIEWTNAPEGAAKQFRHEWFQGNGSICRKILPIEYNP